MNSNKELCLLFSGGSDSTLAAALLAEKFSKIHLITCKFSAITESEKSQINMKRLQEKFPQVKFIYDGIDVENYFNRVYYDRYISNFLKYGFYIENICIACKLAMFIGAADYCVKNDIHFLASGANRKSGIVFADQMPSNIEALQLLLKKYEIEYLIPTYDIEHSDWKLFDMGITPIKQIKFPSPEAYKEQPGCYCGKMHSIYVHGYYFPVHGKNKFFKTAHNHFMDKLNIVEDYIKRFKKAKDASTSIKQFQENH